MSALSHLLLWKSDIDAANTIHPSLTTRPNPLVVDDLVIATLFQPASVLALHRNDGSVAWRREVGKFAADTIHANGVLYVHTSASIVALRAESGQVLWEFRAYDCAETIYSSPVISGDTLFIGDRRGFLHALDLATGLARWSRRISSRGNDQVNATGVVGGDVFIGANNAGIAFAIDRVTAEILWQRDLDAGSISELLLYRGMALVLTGSSVWGLDPSTGEVRERWQFDGQTIHAMEVAGDRLLLNLADDPQRGVLLVMSGREELARHEDAARQMHMRACGPFIYEGGVGAMRIRSGMGEMLHEIGENGLLTVATPDIHEGTLYILVEFFSKRVSAVCALRHPC